MKIIVQNAHRGDYDLSYQVDQKYSAARKAVADFIGARKEEIIYTSGATAGLNMVAIGFGMCYLQPGDVILTSEAEHASNLCHGSVVPCKLVLL